MTPDELKDKLKNALKTVHKDVYLKNSAPEILPGMYIVYSAVSSVTDSYDNAESVTKWRLDTIAYGVDPVAVNSLAVSAREAVKNAGFIPIGKGNDIVTGNAQYTGWIQEYYYIETED